MRKRPSMIPGGTWLIMGLILTANVACSKSFTGDVGKWQWGPVLPQKKSAFGTAASSDRIITVGGTCWRQEEDSAFTKIYLASVHQLVKHETSWSGLPDYPHPIGYPLVIVDEGTVFVIGGHDGAQPLREVWILDLDARAPSWCAGPSLPFPASRVRGGVLDGRIYAVIQREGLVDVDGETVVGRDASILAWNSKESTSDWEKISTLPEAYIQYRSVALCGEDLFFFGGGIPRADGEMDLQARSASFHLSTRTWREIHPLPIAMRDASAIALDDRCVLITGGVEQAAPAEATSDGAPRIILMNQCLIYDSLMDSYGRGQPLRMAVADHGLALLNGKVHVVAGEDSVYRTRTDLVQIGSFD